LSKNVRLFDMRARMGAYVENEMLNAEDALGLQEDLAIIRANRNRARSAASQGNAAQDVETLGAMASATAVLRANKDTISSLRASLNETASNRNDVAAIAVSARETIAALVEEVARLKGSELATVQEQADRLLSRHYDRHIEEMLEKGSLSGDPRQNPEIMKIRTWYTP